MNVGPIHWLVVHHFDPEAPEDIEFEIEHPGCPEVPMWDAPNGETITRYDCAVEMELDAVGLLDGLEHTPIFENSGTEGMVPGRYPIQAWMETYPGGPWGATEYNGGLRLVPEEEMADA